jgi:hypothetical protein
MSAVFDNPRAQPDRIRADRAERGLAPSVWVGLRGLGSPTASGEASADAFKASRPFAAVEIGSRG